MKKLKPVSEMDYKELKKEALELGMKIIGKTTNEMRAYVEKNRVEEAKPEKKKESPPKEEKEAARGAGTAQKIRDLYNAGKEIQEIKKELGLEKGHYVNDIIWRVKNAS